MRLPSLFLVFGWYVALVLTGCAISAPVQEMSNARQTIQAAKDVGAGEYAPELLSIAEKLLDKAARKLEQGDYAVARDFALEAQEQAMLARQKAVDKSGNRPQND
ncbi:DUF4398 domain-containing protein [Thiohalophilus sp.]|uniref:DUF4398 domain-containing protein n=1 Tax=Thiohalophilus sp. TaxID=3028392 RepID=UPI002ACDC865|nr:DUF4398 domain-containing protein [Thiohalophilus sp.]MDZ7663515.1 DUF4398 domain-containing protein [Thiohalophilus sp.]